MMLAVESTALSLCGITHCRRLWTPIVLAVEVKSLKVLIGFCRLAFCVERAAAKSVLLKVVEASMKGYRC